MTTGVKDVSQLIHRYALAYMREHTDVTYTDAVRIVLKENKELRGPYEALQQPSTEGVGDVSRRVSEAAKLYMLEHPVEFVDAVRAVLAQDEALKAEYFAQGDISEISLTNHLKIGKYAKY